MHVLSLISEGQSKHTPLGAIVAECWNNIEKQFRVARCDAFVVMPNHIHGILQINESEITSLSTVIQNFKSLSTRRINNVRKSPGQSVWQRNYYERIIRTERALSLIRLYIKLNPVLWGKNLDLADMDLSEEKLSDLLSEFL